LDFRGRPFAVRILEALEALDVKARVVVLGPDAARIRPALATHDCVIVEHDDLAGGAIGSLRAALAALEPVRPSGVVAWPVDLPHVRVATLERLLEAYRRSGAPAVVPSFAERRGQPVIWIGRCSPSSRPALPRPSTAPGRCSPPMSRISSP